MVGLKFVAMKRRYHLPPLITTNRWRRLRQLPSRHLQHGLPMRHQHQRHHIRLHRRRRLGHLTQLRTRRIAHLEIRHAGDEQLRWGE